MAKTIQIGGRRFDIERLPAEKAIEVEVFLARTVGEPLLKLAVASDESPDKAVEIAGSVVATLGRNLKASEVIALMKDVFSRISCEGKAIEINATFVDRPREPWELLIAGLKENFADFFPESLLVSLRKARTSPSTPSDPSTSTPT